MPRRSRTDRHADHEACSAAPTRFVAALQTALDLVRLGARKAS